MRAALADTGSDSVLPLPNVASHILAKIIEYCKYHTDAEKVTEEKPAAPASEIKAWDTEFVKVDHGTLFEIILVRLPAFIFAPHLQTHEPNTPESNPQGANYLDIKSLLDLTCLTVSSMIKGKSPEEIRNTFNIKSEFTPVRTQMHIPVSYEAMVHLLTRARRAGGGACGAPRESVGF